MAEAEFFRVRWSAQIPGEAERAVAKLMAERRITDATAQAARIRAAVESVFEDASVTGHEKLADSLEDLPDPGDAHVIAAAMKTRASVIVTANVRGFPPRILAPLDLEAKTVDAFVADTIGLDAGRAVAAVRRMRQRFKKPEKTPDVLLLDMEKVGLTQTVDALREHLPSL